jgi:putative ABC transport system substrate-binding protein
MNRRAAIAALCAVLLGHRALASGKRVPVIGVLTTAPPPTPEQVRTSRLRNRLRELGWTVDQDVRIERSPGDGRMDRLPEMAEELVRKRVDVIWADGPEAALAAARATKQIPIVFWGVAFPVEQGLVASLARPGGNVTGTAWWTGVEMAGKQLGHVRELVPGATRVAQIHVPSAVADALGALTVNRRRFDAVARELGLELERHTVREAQDLDGVFERIEASRPDAMLVAATVLTLRERQRIFRFAERARIPALYGEPSWAVTGGLLAFGPVIESTVVQSFNYVDRILRGAKPADLPVEMPRAYELVINLNAAKAIGLAVPASLLVRADRIIE